MSQRWFRWLTTVIVVLSWASVASAQALPKAQPIKLISVFPPGGSVDQVARILQVPLQQHLGQTVVVENRGGASGAIGTASVLNAPADGYTFAVVFDTHGQDVGYWLGFRREIAADIPTKLKDETDGINDQATESQG